jgi:hypothetical protein
MAIVSEDGIDAKDFQTLMQAILRSAIMDYITLQHPSRRRKADVKKALGVAWDMLFDETYLAMKLHTPEGDPMSLKDILEGAQPNNVININDIREKVIEEAASFWSAADVQTLDIPEFLAFRGHVYNVYDQPDTSTVDFVEKTIYQDQSKGSTSQQEFVARAMEVAAHHTEAKISQAALASLATAWFEILRMNNCFAGV